jgi:hypothetical protein
MAKKRTFREFKQGIYKPINKSKCLNKGEIVYRSGLERSMMTTLDKNPNVISWGSENVIIPYYKSVEKRNARYFLDFYMKLRLGEIIKEFIVEVKPANQLKNVMEGVSHKNKKPSTIAYDVLTAQTNKDKWDAARAWCGEQLSKKSRNIEFIILTEKNIDSLFH